MVVKKNILHIQYCSHNVHTFDANLWVRESCEEEKEDIKHNVRTKGSKRRRGRN